MTRTSRNFRFSQKRTLSALGQPEPRASFQTTASFSGAVCSVERPGRCLVCELTDGIGDPAPHGLAIVIVLPGELVGASGAFLKGLVAVPLEHEVGGAPDVDLGYHREQVARLRSPIV